MNDFHFEYKYAFLVCTDKHYPPFFGLLDIIFGLPNMMYQLYYMNTKVQAKFRFTKNLHTCLFYFIHQQFHLIIVIFFYFQGF